MFTPKTAQIVPWGFTHETTNTTEVAEGDVILRLAAERSLDLSRPTDECSCVVESVPHSTAIGETFLGNESSGWSALSLQAETPFRLTNLPLSQSLDVEYTKLPDPLTDPGLRLLHLLTRKEDVQDIVIAPFAVRVTFAALSNVKTSRGFLQSSLSEAGCPQLTEAKRSTPGF